MCEQVRDSLFIPELAEIVRVEGLTATEKLFEVRFKNKRELGHLPGQFVEVSVFGIGEAPSLSPPLPREMVLLSWWFDGWGM